MATPTDEGANEFLLRGIEYMYPGKWISQAPFITCIETDNIGILVYHDKERGLLSFASFVLDDLTYSEELVRRVGMLNRSIMMGAYVLAAVRDNWALTYAIKTSYAWVDPSSKRSAQLVIDAINAVPDFVRRGIAELSAEFGGAPFGVPEAWWFALLDSY